ncbi:MAG: hypothetical protein DCF28_06695 [Alphaproteobacteria bacterium]|nr:MAG: hypothetical protein DCF28_06695 [Alphaproteobacteria bacterium]PZO39890.1 MAG: hypothetical protein DCE92_03585 [Alphaproteobacteria bacterium]
MTSEYESFARPRPIRVAFLVADDENSAIALDAIFADSYGRWGGRFSLIVPCVDARVSAAYWPWLEAFDPDIVYSYVPLSRADVDDLIERVSPSEYKLHRHGDPEGRELAARDFRPTYNHGPMSSLSTVFRSARYTKPADAAAPVQLLNAWHGEQSSRFLTDNMGTLDASFGNANVPPDASTILGLQTILTVPEPERRRFGIPRDLNVLPTESAAFAAFAERHVDSLSIRSTLFAPKLGVRTRMSGAFNLVVGDTFADRLLFWNARLLIPAWLDDDICCLRIELAQLEDPIFLASLVQLLRNRNRVNGGNGGQSQVAIRSTSVSVEDLTAAEATLRAQNIWCGARPEALASLDEILPTVRELENAQEGNAFGETFMARPDWTRTLWSDGALRPPVLMPNHLIDAPPRQGFTQGYWAVDFNIECPESGLQRTPTNRWMLPRRWRVAESFTVRYGGHRPIRPMLRRSRNGNLGALVSIDHPVESITIPNVAEAIPKALTAFGPWTDVNRDRRGGAPPPGMVTWAEPSNEARYLTGVLGMLGGLSQASAVLLHQFLLETFARLGGTPNLSEDKVAPIASSLWKKARQNPVFDLRDDREKQVLASLIVKAAKGEKSVQGDLRYDDLKTEWANYRKRYWDVQQRREPDDEGEWAKAEEASLDRCLAALRDQQAIFQGHEWLCRECHHRNWVGLSDLKPSLSCEVCRANSQAPIDVRWQFRPNRFLIESLRSHSALSLIWLLGKLGWRARSSFYYVGPTIFGFTPESKNSDAEADLLAVVDGRTFVCEVKSSWSVMRKHDLTKTVDLARRLRADVALIAIMEDKVGMVDEFAEARAALDGSGIQLELLTFGQPDLDDSTLLPD